MRAFALAGLAMLAGCGGAGQADGEQSAGQEPEAVESPEPTANATAREPMAVVYAKGVSFGTRRMPFRTARRVIEKEARVVFPDLTFEIDHNPECGAGPMEFTSFGPLTLNFQEDRLVGWFMEKGPGMQTADGIRPGMTLAELREQRSVELLPNSTLGGEFTYMTPDGGTIDGFLEGEGDGAIVTALYAGTNCFFR
ncbi:hypothetical protein FHS61_001818 [Altererythrobacter atlanticus]|uniref:Uncharacterized protein n=1 Tax=Croceibacterium atlanticum TaxID=1267766 RepID=A0A0F7KQ85_9SPHN|nr:hypothetical protein [Croceibacterium atlanticum]AKH41291.1 hypothetical protein WYH_00227 [Croceibacterium atlanticum]MBB5732809.1 hypothetical protein [Croceibacterium atlanticum]